MDKNSMYTKILTYIHTMPYDSPEKNANEILPNIWLGNYLASQDKIFITNNNIKYIINISDDLPNKFIDITYLNFYIKDIKICQGQYSKEKLCESFNIAHNFVIDAIKKNKGVLIHCKRGHHRSAAFLAAFISKFLDVDYFTTIKYIKKHRPNTFRRETCILKYLLSY